MLKMLREKNPSLRFYDVFDEAFSEYGRVLSLDPSELVEAAGKIENPESGSAYLPSVDSFEATRVAGEICESVFGTLDTELGYCWGHSETLGGTEWHASSELNVAVTPLVLILGRRCDLSDGRLDSATMKAFYVPKGTVLEVYATTLHFCPCQVSDEGFGMVVGLPRGTNTPLEGSVGDRLLFRRNKWIISHEENASLLARGVVPGVYGENYKINY